MILRVLGETLTFWSGRLAMSDNYNMLSMFNGVSPKIYLFWKALGKLSSKPEIFIRLFWCKSGRNFTDKKTAVLFSTAKAALVIKKVIDRHNGSLSCAGHIWIANWYGYRTGGRRHSWMSRLIRQKHRCRTFAHWHFRKKAGYCWNLPSIPK